MHALCNEICAWPLNHNTHLHTCTLIEDRLLSRWIYWTESKRISRSSLDGTDFRIFLSEHDQIYWPTGLTLDYYTQTLYWIDTESKTISLCKTDGRQRRLLYSENIIYPFGITVFEDEVCLITCTCTCIYDYIYMLIVMYMFVQFYCVCLCVSLFLWYCVEVHVQGLYYVYMYMYMYSMYWYIS